MLGLTLVRYILQCQNVTAAVGESMGEVGRSRSVLSQAQSQGALGGIKKSAPPDNK